MFEDETVDVACPKCGHRNSILVRDFEENAETHFVCTSCGVGVKIEADEFKHRLDQVLKEVEDLEREAARDAKRPPKRPRKGDFQI
jgi:DNA-directed RNA polymerase subunit RPC12/RpoP